MELRTKWSHVVLKRQIIYEIFFLNFIDLRMAIYRKRGNIIGEIYDIEFPCFMITITHNITV